jgi:hypothetical protein
MNMTLRSRPGTADDELREAPSGARRPFQVRLNPPRELLPICPFGCIGSALRSRTVRVLPKAYTRNHIRAQESQFGATRRRRRERRCCRGQALLMMSFAKHLREHGAQYRGPTAFCSIA